MALEDRIRLPALNLIHRRRRLLNMLDGLVEAGNRLITIYAPGGYGKSILLADFAQTTDLPVCWCSLEPADRDPTSFLTLLARSITNRFFDLPAGKLFKLVERGDTQASVHYIAELLAGVGPHIIIIDDYHKAVSAGMALALNRLLQQLPENSCIIVAARGDMALELGQIIDLLITERAAGLSEEELRFTPEELQRVMLKRFGRRVELKEAKEIARATDGNIAQILLTGHITHTQNIIGSLRQRLGNDQDLIYSYLADEVFGKQPAELQQFLLATSVLPELTTGLCNELLEITNARHYINTLEQEDLFITQIGNSYRYHDLFAGFLHHRLARDPAAFRRLTIKAGNLLANRGRFEEAIERYLLVQAWPEAVALLAAQGKTLYDTGRALTLNTWLAQISHTELARHPRLLLLQGQILNNDLGKPETAISFFQEAEELFRKQGNNIAAAEAQIWRSVSLRMMGQASEAVALADTGLECLKTLQADTAIIAWAVKNHGLAYGTTGNMSKALEDMRQALELFTLAGDMYQQGMCHHDIGVCLVALGNISGADHHYRQAIRIWETLGNANDLANTLNSLGVSLCAVGNYREALEQFNNCLNVALPIGAIRRAAFAQSGIGEVHLGRGNYTEAIKAFALSNEMAHEAGARALEVYNLVKMGEASYRLKNLGQALKLAGRAQEIAAEIGLSVEQGLACALQAKIYVGQGEYPASFKLFAKALDELAQNNVLEAARARLWWGFALLRDLRTQGAYRQLQEAVRLALAMGELLPGLGATVAETRSLLLHFLYRADTPAGMRDSINLLLEQDRRETPNAASGLQIFAFGAPVVIVSGARKQFSQRGKARRMPEFLLYLVLEGRDSGCRWDQIAGEIWPEIEADQASTTFHVTLKRLRSSMLESSTDILVENDYYRVDPSVLEWCDVLAFETLFERAATAGPQEALELYLEMISLYQGEFLAGFDLEEWGQIRRSRYETIFLQAVELAAKQLLENGSAQEAVTVVNRGLAVDYFREDLHRCVLRAYAQLGLYDDLTAHYNGLCQIFEQEFNAPPEPATRRLFKELSTEKGTVKA